MIPAAPYPAIDKTAPCTKVDPEIFFVSRGNAAVAIDVARRVCKGDNSNMPCPFLAGCLNWALTHAVEGVWGGKSDVERKAIRKKYSIKAEPLELTVYIPRGPAPRNLIPHGTSVGVEKHRRKYEPLCDVCFGFDVERKATGVATGCPDCGLALQPGSVRKHRRAHCPNRAKVPA
jgi:hypothetical protein